MERYFEILLDSFDRLHQYAYMHYYLLLFIILISSCYGHEINLIGYRNGVGLNQDIDILTQELTALGHKTQFVDCNDLNSNCRADINLFIDVFQEKLFSLAEKNYYLPNPEWCFLPAEKLALFDGILCKTREAERIFKQFNPSVAYIGFTSKDRYDENVAKNYKKPLHLVGASIQKGTQAVVQTWLQNPQFPTLLIVRHKGSLYIPSSPNIILITDYLSDTDLRNVQNGNGLHLCPSETEGFGHYIMEALSAGNVVVTTDAPPMNEFVLDQRCLVKYQRTYPRCLATSYCVDLQQLDLTVSNLLNLPENELHEIGQKNRQLYLKNHEAFKVRLAELFR